MAATLLSCGLLLPTTALFAQLPSVELHGLPQSAMQAGTSVEMLVTEGAYLDELDHLRFTTDSSPLGLGKQEHAHPLQCKRLPTGAMRITASPQAQLGLWDVQAVGRFGMSNPRRLLLTRSPVVRVASEHAQPATAMALPPRTIVSAFYSPQQRSYYRVELSPGDRLKVVAAARLLDSRAVPNLVLIDEQGRECARARAAGDWPAEIDFAVTRSGSYLLATHDFLFHGGGAYPYVLEYTLSDASDEKSEPELGQLLKPRLPDGTANARSQLSGFAYSGFASVPATTTSAKAELEPPFQIEDSLRAHDSKHFDFVARRGQNLWLEIASAAFGQLTDPRMLLFKIDPQNSDNHQRLLDVDDGPAFGDAAVRIRLLDPQVGWSVPEDGRYRIQIEDNEQGPRPADACSFRLTVKEAEPQFKLLAYHPYPNNNPATAKPTGSNLMLGGTETVRVLVVRCSGFADAIMLSVENLPPGVTAAPAIIAPSQSIAALTLQCEEQALAWNGPIRVVGKAAELTSTAESATIVWPVIPTRNVVEARPSSGLSLHVNAAESAPLRVQIGEPEQMHECSPASSLQIPVEVIRRAGGEGTCLLRPQDLPPKITVAELSIPADQSTATLEVKTAADTPAGEYTFWMQNETKVKWRENPQALARAEALLQQLNEQLAAADDEQKPQLEAAIGETTRQIEGLRPRSAEKELTVWLPTNLIRLRVAASKSN